MWAQTQGTSTSIHLNKFRTHQNDAQVGYNKLVHRAKHVKFTLCLCVCARTFFFFVLLRLPRFTHFLHSSFVCSMVVSLADGCCCFVFIFIYFDLHKSILCFIFQLRYRKCVCIFYRRMPYILYYCTCRCLDVPSARLPTPVARPKWTEQWICHTYFNLFPLKCHFHTSFVHQGESGTEWLGEWVSIGRYA